MSVTVQTQPTTPFTLSAADEALAVRLQAHDEDAWRGLLGSVEPTFGDPVAEKVAAIMRRRLQDGVEYREMGGMIREMLHTRADEAEAAAAPERWPVDPEQDYGGDFPDPDYDEEDWGTAGGPPLPGRRLIDGEWKSVPYAEWTDADKALAEEIYGHDSDAEDERLYEEWLAKRDQWLQRQSKETLIKMVLMDDLEKELYIDKHMDDSEAE